MAVTNRDLDASEQRLVVHRDFGAVPVTTNRNIFTAQFPVAVEQLLVAANGLSGAPTWTFKIDRFIVGAGLTTITGTSFIGQALTVQTIGTSGLQSVSLLSGLQMNTGDVLKVTSSGANTAVADASVHVVVKALQDIKTYFGTIVS